MTKPRTVRWGPVALATIAAIATFWVIGWITSDAGAQAAIDHSDLDHHHGFTNRGDASDWPPRPEAATTDLVPASGIDAEAGNPGVTVSRAQAGALSPSSLPGLTDQLGSDWVHISSSPARAGKDNVRPAEETFFSRDLNQTVIVRSTVAGAEILTFAASEVQPVVSEVEGAQAADLGRTWLIEQGHGGVAGLEGFAIRALDDGALYDVRMVYVTYAPSWFDDPLYAAYVDMTNLTVVEGGQL